MAARARSCRGRCCGRGRSSRRCRGASGSPSSGPGTTASAGPMRRCRARCGRASARRGRSRPSASEAAPARAVRPATGRARAACRCPRGASSASSAARRPWCGRRRCRSTRPARSPRSPGGLPSASASHRGSPDRGPRATAVRGRQERTAVRDAPRVVRRPERHLREPRPHGDDGRRRPPDLHVQVPRARRRPSRRQPRDHARRAVDRRARVARRWTGSCATSARRRSSGRSRPCPCRPPRARR